MSLSNDALTRVCAVLDGLRAADSDCRNAYDQWNTHGDDPDEESDLADWLRDARDVLWKRRFGTAPSLIALADAVAKLANRNHGHHPWWVYFNGDGRYVYCFGCRGGGKTANDVDHAAECCALAIDAAFGDIAALDGNA